MERREGVYRKKKRRVKIREKKKMVERREGWA